MSVMKREASPSASRDALRACVPAFLTLAVFSGLAIVSAITLPKALSSEPAETPAPQPEIPMDVVYVDYGQGQNDILVQQCVPASPAEDSVLYTEYVLKVPADSSVGPGDQMIIQA